MVAPACWANNAGRMMTIAPSRRVQASQASSGVGAQLLSMSPELVLAAPDKLCLTAVFGQG
jgi:hypothetical protein